MKIRTSFVSNSSTTNFIIRIKQDDWFKEKNRLFLANDEDIVKLEEYGFERINLINPFKNEEDRMIKSGNPDNYLSMKYFVTCNEEEVIEFLVKNNIPFKASVHYGHYYMSYKKDSDYIFRATNYGLIFNMYGEDNYDYFTEEDMKKLDFKPYQKIPKSEYIGADDK